MSLKTKLIKIIKTLIIKPILHIIGRRRIGINNHTLSSKEITTINQYANRQSPSKKLLQLVGDIYIKYHEFIPKYLNPSIKNNLGKIWDQYPRYMTGEHYALLPHIANLIKCKRLVEIGTFMGCSAKSLLLNSDCNVITFDIIPFDNFKYSYLSDDDFKDSRLRQIIADLSDINSFKKYQNLLMEADMFFIDGPKNYEFELVFLDLLINELEKKNKSTILIIDDINVSTMKDIWNNIEHPKIMLDQIGHWSGTGLVIIN